MQSIPCAICGEVHWPICKRESVTKLSSNAQRTAFVTKLRESLKYTQAIAALDRESTAASVGRPRLHQSNAARQKAYRERKKS